MFTRFREDFPDFAGVEVPDPHVGQAGVRGRKHQVGKDDGGIGFGGIHAVAFADPGFFVPAADNQHHRGSVAGMDGPQPGQRFLALDHPDAGGLEILGGRGHAAGVQDHLQLGFRNGIGAEGVTGVAAFQDAHESIRAIIVLGDLLLYIRESGTVHDLAGVAHATEVFLYHLVIVLNAATCLRGAFPRPRRP